MDFFLSLIFFFSFFNFFLSRFIVIRFLFRWHSETRSSRAVQALSVFYFRLRGAMAIAYFIWICSSFLVGNSGKNGTPERWIDERSLNVGLFHDQGSARKNELWPSGGRITVTVSIFSFSFSEISFLTLFTVCVAPYSIKTFEFICAEKAALFLFFFVQVIFHPCWVLVIRVLPWK